MSRTQTTTGNATNNNNIPSVTLRLVMSCDIFWKYEMDIVVDRQRFDPKFTNRDQDETEAFDTLSRHLCYEMKKYIHGDLTRNAEHGLIRKLEEVFRASSTHEYETSERPPPV